MQQTYPDISDTRSVSAKAERRRALAALSWEEKVAIIERMQTLLPKGMWRDMPADESSRGALKRPADTTKPVKTG